MKERRDALNDSTASNASDDSGFHELGDDKDEDKDVTTAPSPDVPFVVVVSAGMFKGDAANRMLVAFESRALEVSEEKENEDEWDYLA